MKNILLFKSKHFFTWKNMAVRPCFLCVTNHLDKNLTGGQRYVFSVQNWAA